MGSRCAFRWSLKLLGPYYRAKKVPCEKLKSLGSFGHGDFAPRLFHSATKHMDNGTVGARPEHAFSKARLARAAKSVNLP